MPTFFASSSPVASAALLLNQSLKMTAQLAVEGTGAVAASAVIEGSHDGRGWVNVATLDASGTTYASDGGTFETYWPQLRGRLVSVTGTATLYYGAQP